MVMTKIHIQFTLFSAFYSPLISTMTGGFLREEGLEYEWSVAPEGKSAIESLMDRSAHVVQTAPSQSFGPLSKGEIMPWAHFAQINEMDGFFLTGRDADPEGSGDENAPRQQQHGDLLAKKPHAPPRQALPKLAQHPHGT